MTITFIINDINLNYKKYFGEECLKIIDIIVNHDIISSYETHFNISVTYLKNNSEKISVCEVKTMEHDGKIYYKYNCSWNSFPYLFDNKCEDLNVFFENYLKFAL